MRPPLDKEPMPLEHGNRGRVGSRRRGDTPPVALAVAQAQAHAHPRQLSKMLKTLGPAGSLSAVRLRQQDILGTLTLDREADSPHIGLTGQRKPIPADHAFAKVRISCLCHAVRHGAGARETVPQYRQGRVPQQPVRLSLAQ